MLLPSKSPYQQIHFCHVDKRSASSSNFTNSTRPMPATTSAVERATASPNCRRILLSALLCALSFLGASTSGFLGALLIVYAAKGKDGIRVQPEILFVCFFFALLFWGGLIFLIKRYVFWKLLVVCTLILNFVVFILVAYFWTAYNFL
jgi:hypothetical protein